MPRSSVMGTNIIFYSSDPNIQSWWEGLDKGKRSATLCDIIRQAIAPPALTPEQRLQRACFELKQIVKAFDTRDLEDAFRQSFKKEGSEDEADREPDS